MLKIKYFPKPFKSNQYVQNSIDSIEGALDAKIDFLPSISTVIRNPKIIFGTRRSDLLIINWLENRLSSPSGGFSLFGSIQYVIFLTCFRLVAKRIIYVRHNIFPHNMKGRRAELAQFIITIGEKLCHQKISHSGHLTDRGYTYVPHPLYKLNADKEHRLCCDNYYVMFGKIDRYKKMEIVIQNWTIEQTLLIIGTVVDNEYLSEITKLAKGKNVKIEARFIPDDEAAAIVSNSQGVILAHAQKNMIVSGSFFFAITLGVPVFAVEIPFFTWLKQEYNFSGLHIYSEPKQIIDGLLKTKALNKQTIQNEAEILFGKEAVNQGWKNAIKSIYNPG